MTHLPRREFLSTTAAAAMAASGLGTATAGLLPHAAPADDTKFPLGKRLYKTLKIGMVKEGDTLTEKFRAAKTAGFHGIELNAPTINVAETLQAIKDSGLPVDGSVNSTHWQVRHTDPKPEVRQRALESLKNAIRSTHAVGGHTCLLVVGHGKDGPEEEIWQRAIENISKALPVAAEYGVYIAIENVWNQFLYDHAGDSNQTADKFVKFVDELNSPWVGMQFDIGNHWKYGSMGDWIRQLGRRVVKLDVKGFSRAKNTFTKIGEGDIDWTDVRKALTEINYYGWCAAEVGGGKLDRLQEISANMDRVFGLSNDVQAGQ